MKKIIVILAVAVISANLASAAPDSKLLLLFNQTFPKAENIKWHDEADGYVVSFIMNGINNRICYNYKNEFVSGERYYNETMLPSHILFAVKKKYAGKEIFGITELTDQSTLNYHIILKDDKKIYTIKVSINGSMQLENTYTSALDN